MCRPCRPVGTIFLAGANFLGKAREKQAKTRENRRKTGAFLVLIFWGEKLVSANFYAFCNYAVNMVEVVIMVEMVIMLNVVIMVKMVINIKMVIMAGWHNLWGYR